MSERTEMLIIENNDEPLTEQELSAIRGLLMKGCDAGEVAELFGLKPGELERIVNDRP